MPTNIPQTNLQNTTQNNPSSSSESTTHNTQTTPQSYPDSASPRYFKLRREKGVGKVDHPLLIFFSSNFRVGFFFQD